MSFLRFLSFFAFVFKTSLHLCFCDRFFVISLNLCHFLTWVYVCVCVFVCNLAFLHHQLVNCPLVWSTGNESDSVPHKRACFTRRQQLIGWAWVSPLPAWAPRTEAHPSLLPFFPPSHWLSSELLAFSYLHAGQNTRLLLHVKPSAERLRTQNAAIKKTLTNIAEEKKREETIANDPAFVLAGGKLPVDLSMTSLFGLLQTAPSFSPLETASDLQK